MLAVIYVTPFQHVPYLFWTWEKEDIWVQAL